MPNYPDNPYRPMNTTNYEHARDPHLNDLHNAMAYDPYGAPIIRVDNTTQQHTAKNRLKVSPQELQYFNTFQYGRDTNIWDEVTTNGASLEFDQYLGMVKMSVTNQLGSQAIQQSKRVIRYIPGRQNELSFSVIFTMPVAGIRRRIGLFDELGGFYFEDGGDGNYYCVLRRNTAAGVVETRVAREDWNVDPLDGTGPSGYIGDPNAVQMVTFEYDWYGAGQVEVNWIIKNNKYPVHQFNTGNIEPHTWTQTPFLPVRKEITNVTGAAGTHSMYVGSTSIYAEAETNIVGRESNAASPITGKSTGNTANAYVPILSIRLKSDRLRGVVIPIDFQAATLDNTSIFFRLVSSPTLTGASWVSAGTESFVEYDVSATASTGGTVMKTGYLSSSNQGDVQSFDAKTNTQMGRTNLGTASEILTIEVASTQANKSAFASMNWIEIR